MFVGGIHHVSDVASSPYRFEAAILSCVGHKVYAGDYRNGHDLALCRLSVSVPYETNPWIGFTCLPPHDFKLPEGATMLFVGWGRTQGLHEYVVIRTYVLGIG